MNTRGPYAKKEKHTENIYARYKLLKAGIAEPNKVSANVISSLSGQRRFAALALTSKDIEPIALNTLKSVADDVLCLEAPSGNGFEYLDSLRLELKAMTEHKTRPARQKNKNSSNKALTQDIKQQLQQAQLLNLQRSKAYLDLFSTVSTLTKEAPMEDAVRLRLYNLLQDHRDLYAHLLGPNDNQPDGDTGPLRMLPGGRK